MSLLSAYRADSFITLVFPESVRPVITRVIEPALTYVEQQFLRGQDAYDPVTGRHRPMRHTTVSTFRYDERGGLVFPLGYWPDVAQLLAANDITPPTLPRLPPPVSRPNALMTDLDGLFACIAAPGVYPFRYRQDEALAAVSAAIDSGIGGIVNAPTGIGKGFLIVALTKLYSKARIDIIAPSLPTVRNLEKRLNLIIPDLGVVGGGTRKLGRRVTLFCADSLHLAPHEGDDEADIVIFDEVHEAAAPTIAQKLMLYRRPPKIGLTASYNLRFDGRDHVIKGLFGPERFYMSYDEGANNGVVVPIRVDWLNPVVDPSLTSQLKTMSPLKAERYGIWQNAARNQMFAQKAIEYYEAGNQTLILVKTVEHAFHLKRFLPDWPLVYDKVAHADYARYVQAGLTTEVSEPQMTKPRRSRLTQAFEQGELRCAIANTVWAVGVDFVELGELLRADGMSSNIASVQIPGRTARINTAGSKSFGRITDSKDTFNEGRHRSALTRRKQYAKMGWEQQGW